MLNVFWVYGQGRGEVFVLPSFSVMRKNSVKLPASTTAAIFPLRPPRFA
jgi:hypothetical protein